MAGPAQTEPDHPEGLPPSPTAASSLPPGSRGPTSTHLLSAQGTAGRVSPATSAGGRATAPGAATGTPASASTEAPAGAPGPSAPSPSGPGAGTTLETSTGQPSGLTSPTANREPLSGVSTPAAELAGTSGAPTAQPHSLPSGSGSPTAASPSQGITSSQATRSPASRSSATGSPSVAEASGSPPGARSRAPSPPPTPGSAPSPQSSSAPARQSTAGSSPAGSSVAGKGPSTSGRASEASSSAPLLSASPSESGTAPQAGHSTPHATREPTSSGSPAGISVSSSSLASQPATAAGKPGPGPQSPAGSVSPTASQALPSQTGRPSSPSWGSPMPASAITPEAASISAGSSSSHPVTPSPAQPTGTVSQSPSETSTPLQPGPSGPSAPSTSAPGSERAAVPTTSAGTVTGPAQTEPDYPEGLPSSPTAASSLPPSSRGPTSTQLLSAQGTAADVSPATSAGGRATASGAATGTPASASTEAPGGTPGPSASSPSGPGASTSPEARTGPPSRRTSSSLSQAPFKAATPLHTKSSALFPETSSVYSRTSTLSFHKCSTGALYIILEKVTGKVIQFHWILRNGRRDSVYTVTLAADNIILNETNTNTTNIVFENLSPGYQYRISVDVQSCYKKISSSEMVRTEATAYNLTVRITNKEYLPQYSNKSSPEFQNCQKECFEEIKEHSLPPLRNLLDSGKVRLTITRIRPGSVIVDLVIKMVPDTNMTHFEVERAIIEALNKSKTLKVDLTKTSITVIPVCQPGYNGCSKYAYCFPKRTTYICQCRSGFQDESPLVPGRQCQDINECKEGNQCSYLASCTNTIGSYKCQCYPGLKDLNPTDPGRLCQDPIQCFNRSDFCSQPTKCLDLQHFICSSKEAFACNIFFKKMNFSFPDLYNPKSEIYENLTETIRKTIITGMAEKLRDDNFDIKIVGYQPGSVIAYFAFLVYGEQFIEIRKFTADLTEVVKEMLDNQTEITVTAITTFKPAKEDSTWKTGVIVLAVLFCISLILILVIVSVWLYIKNKTGMYSIESEAPMGNYYYKGSS